MTWRKMTNSTFESLLFVGLIVVILLFLGLGVVQESLKPACNQRCNDFNSRYIKTDRVSGLMFTCKCADQNDEVHEYIITG